jgi:WD40 repeat protein
VTPDGKTLAAIVMGSDDSRQLKIWNIDTGREEPAPDVPGFLGPPGLCLEPDMQTLAIPIELTETTGPKVGISYWDLSAKKLKTAHDYLYPRCSNRDMQRYSRHALVPLSGSKGGDSTVSVELTENKFVIRNWQTEQVIREFINPTSWQTTPSRTGVFPFRTGRLLDRAGVHLSSNQLLMLHSALYTSASQSGGEINFWNLDTRKLKETITTDAPVTEIAIRNDGKLLAARTSTPAKIHVEPDRRVTIWDFDKRKEVFAFDHEDRVRSIAFSPDGKLLAIADSSHVYFREVATGMLVDSLNAGNTGSGSMAFSDDGQKLVVGNQLWNVTQRRKEWELTEYADSCMFFSPDGKSIAATSAKGIALINASVGKVNFRLENNGQSRYVYFTSDGSKLNIIRENPSGQYCDLWVLDLATRKETLKRRDVGGRPWTSSWNESRRMAMNRSASTVASSRSRQDYSDWEGEIVLTNVTREEQTALLNAPTGDIASVLFMPDGSTLASGGQSRNTSLLEIVDITTGKLVAKLSNVMCDTVSPDGEYLVTQHLQGGGLVLWKTRGGIELARFPVAEHAQFSPDGTVLGTGEAGVLKLWNVADFLKVE